MPPPMILDGFTYSPDCGWVLDLTATGVRLPVFRSKMIHYASGAVVVCSRVRRWGSAIAQTDAHSPPCDKTATTTWKPGHSHRVGRVDAADYDDTIAGGQQGPDAGGGGGER